MRKKTRDVKQRGILRLKISIDILMFFEYDKETSLVLTINYIRGCTGFDGGVEVWEAIRRLRDCVITWNLNIKANEDYALAA